MNRLGSYHRRLVLHGGKKPLDRLILMILLPLSLGYGIIAWLRRAAYAIGLLPSYTATVKVISVGNLAVGGTGKTPVVDWLVKTLVEQGRHPAVVSRGYGGTFSGAVGVVSDGQVLLLSAAAAGDEPCLLARRNPTVPVLIAAKRALGVRMAAEKYGADIVILDDGFQHLGVRRDVDLVLLDGTYPFGNGLPLPAGLLREFPVALRRADLVLVTRAVETSGQLSTEKPTWQSRHQLADYAVDLQGGIVPLAQLAGKRLLAFAGIADPNDFFQALVQAGVTIEKLLPLGDHERYADQAVQRILAAAEGMDALLTTEKDGVKLAVEQFPLPCYQVPMTVKIEAEAEFKAEFFRRLWSR